MNNKYFVIFRALILFFIVFSFISCNDDLGNKNDVGSQGSNLLPSSVEVGQKIKLSGPGFVNATAIVFPDNITVSTFDKVGQLQLDVVVPSGVKDGGNVIVKLPSGDYTIPVAVKLLKPVVTGCEPVSGALDIGPNEELEIKGKDLINVSEIIFPGASEPTVYALNFRRKGNENIILTVPPGTASVVAPVTLRTKYGTEFQSTPVDFRGGGYIPPEYLMLCGEEGKTWTWDLTQPDEIVYGNGGYLSNVAPAWWTVAVDAVGTAQDRRGATMKFNFSYDGNVMIRTQVNGTEFEGSFKLDMTKKKNRSNGQPWSVGEFDTSGAAGILHGQGRTHFDIMTLSNTEFVVAWEYDNGEGTSDFWMFRAQ